jgi:nucleotidyltransferase/DNA polymerase involved in DNA repair
MFATIYVPNFYLQAALRHQPKLRAKPVALIEEQENKPLIIQLNEAAQIAGIRKGMTPSQALARYLHVVIKVRARTQEKLIEQILLEHAFTLSPYVEATAPGICTIQFALGRQPLRLSAFQSVCNGQDVQLPGQVGCLSSKLSRVIERLRKCEISAQAGIAPLPDASFLAVHLARPVLQIEDAKNFLAPLSIEILTLG